jgi:23S rRNA (adenine2503-C2)-methyltransferase
MYAAAFSARRVRAFHLIRTPIRTFIACNVGSTPTISDYKVINLSTVTKADLETVITSWGHPRFRADQVWNWIRDKGVTNVEEMNNIPKKLRQQLAEYSKPTSLELASELRSKDGTIKRAYRCYDGQLIESVLMPYEDGRYTACISSQAGCAQGCVFCATGQMGFSRQLTSDEIFEQVARFAAELQHEDVVYETKSTSKQHGRGNRLSNVVFMGMGEPLANYRHVSKAINRITQDLGIGARKITVSTVGIVPNIRKLTTDPNMPQVRLAVSLHCATDEERDVLLPANKRYGGLDELMGSLREYIEVTGRRVTLEWALIAEKNDTPETARKLARLIQKSKLRKDMVHVNVIPLNPTGGFGGNPSDRKRVNDFVNTLEKEFGIACTPRVRRGIDIDAGCGQLKSKVLEKESREDRLEAVVMDDATSESKMMIGKEFTLDSAINIEEEDFEDPEFEDESSKAETARLLNLVKATTIDLSKLDGQ